MRHRYSNGAVVAMTVLLLAAVVAFALLSLRNAPDGTGTAAPAQERPDAPHAWTAADGVSPL